MADKDQDYQIITTLAETKQKVADMHDDIRQLKNLPERISLVEKDNNMLHSEIKNVAVKLDEHIQQDSKAFTLLRKWMIGLTALSLIILVSVFGAKQVITWLVGIF